MRVYSVVFVLVTFFSYGTAVLRRGEKSAAEERFLSSLPPVAHRQTNCVDSDVSPGICHIPPYPECTPYRSPERCPPGYSFPLLIQKRTAFIKNLASQNMTMGEWWFHHLENKIAAHIFSLSTGIVKSPKKYFCGTPATLDTFQSPSNTKGFVVRATNLHSNKGVYVLPDGFGGLERIRGITMTINDIRVDLDFWGAENIVIEEYVAGSNGNLPLELKFHVFNGKIGSVNIVSGRGTPCACWAEVDQNQERLDQFGCFTPSAGTASSDKCDNVDFAAGALAVHPMKEMDLCSSLPFLADSYWQDLLLVAEAVGRKIGVYTRVDLFLSGEGEIYLQELSFNHMNGQRHCSAIREPTGTCIDSCFLGDLWQSTGGNSTFGGFKTEIPTQFEEWMLLDTELEKCQAAVVLEHVQPSQAPAVPSANTTPARPINSPPSYNPTMTLSPTSFPVSWLQLGSSLNGEISDGFGESVALSCDGQVLAIGVFRASNVWHVKILVWNSTTSTWDQTMGQIDGTERNLYDGQNRLAISNDGYVLAIGSRRIIGTINLQVYKWNGTVWVQLGETLEYVGSYVSLSGDGSTLVSTVGLGESVRAFRWNGSLWKQLGEDIGGQGSDYVSLSDDGSVLAVSSSNFIPLSIYRWDDTRWLMVGTSSMLGLNTGDSTQADISSDGSIVVVSAAKFVGGNSRGCKSVSRVSVYKKLSDNDWYQLGQHFPEKCSRYDDSVIISSDGNIVALQYGGLSSWTVELFQWDGATWNSENRFSSDHQSSAWSSMALSGDASTLTIGEESNNIGSVNVFMREVPYQSSLIPCSDSSNVLFTMAPATTPTPSPLSLSLPTNWTQLGLQIDNDRGEQRFGERVALSGDGSILAIGVSTVTQGWYVDFYVWNGSNWNQTMGQINDGRAENEEIGYRGFSLSDDGLILAIGVYNRARVYNWDGSSWQQLGETINDGGESISLSGDGSTLAVSDGFFPVKIFRQSDELWIQVGRDLQNVSSYVSLSNDGSILAISGGDNDLAILRWDGTKWLQVGGMAIVTGDPDEFIGTDAVVSSDGSILALISHNYFSGTVDNRVGVYKRLNDTVWYQLGEDFGESNKEMHSVSISNDGAMVAIAYIKYNNPAITGFVQLFQWDGDTWNLLGEIGGTRQYFGRYLALSGDASIVAIGDPGYSVQMISRR